MRRPINGTCRFTAIISTLGFRMNEKEMVLHIKALTKIIEKQADFNEKLQRNFYNIERQISVLHFKLGKLEGMKDD